MGIFRAYDVRGVVPEEIHPEVARRVGYQFARHVGGKTYVVGHDMRPSSPGLAGAFAEGIHAAGGEVVHIGMVPTPLVYFAIGHLGGDGGACITGSHHPAGYNGIKLCREEAIPIGAKTGLKEIEEAYVASLDAPPPAGDATVRREADVLDAYLEHVLGFARVDRKLKVVVDAGNGMAGVTISPILERLSTVEMLPLFLEPDGTFPHHPAHPLDPDNVRDLQQAVLENDADLGIAFDADADRIVFVDERGRIVSPDLITALIARGILAEHPDTAVIYDLRSSWVVPEEIRAWGGHPIEERVGHAFIRATMRERQSYFAGELSGHYYFRDNSYSDCTDLAAIQILSLMCREGKRLSALVRPLKRYRSSGELNFRVEDQEAKILEIAREFAGARIDYLDGITVSYPTWWFNVRKSNTEPLLRLNVEARTLECLDEGRKKLMDLLGEPL